MLSPLVKSAGNSLRLNAIDQGKSLLAEAYASENLPNIQYNKIKELNGLRFSAYNSLGTPRSFLNERNSSLEKTNKEYMDFLFGKEM